MLVGIDASRAVRETTTGTEAYSRQVISALARRTFKHRYRLYVDRTSDLPVASGANVETRLIRLPRMWTHARLGIELWRHPPDLVFIPAHVIPIGCPVPSVVTIHDVGYLWYRAAYRPLAWILLHLGTIWNARAASLIIADSEATASDLVHHFSVNRSKIRVALLGGPDVEAERIGSSRAVRPQGSDGYFVFVGTIHPRKNLARLLHAFAQICERGRARSVRLSIVGAMGLGAGAMRALSQRLGIADQVDWQGYVSDTDRQALVSGALALVFPSLYEGFGLPVLEAMAWGTPVISSTAASLPEVVGSAGLLVDPLDVAGLAAAMLRILDEPELTERLVEAGRARARLFSWDRCADILEAAFESVKAT